VKELINALSLLTIGRVALRLRPTNPALTSPRDRIARAVAEAIRDVKMAAVETASKAAATILTEQLSGKAADDEFSKSLAAAAKALS